MIEIKQNVKLLLNIKKTRIEFFYLLDYFFIHLLNRGNTLMGICSSITIIINNKEVYESFKYTIIINKKITKNIIIL